MRAVLIALLAVCAAPALAQGRRGADKAPAKGSKAPDLELKTLAKDKTPTKKTVKLSEKWAKKPVALIFGSYT